MAGVVILKRFRIDSRSTLKGNRKGEGPKEEQGVCVKCQDCFQRRQ